MTEEDNPSLSFTIKKILSTDIFQLMREKEKASITKNAVEEIKTEENNISTPSYLVTEMNIEENPIPTTANNPEKKEIKQDLMMTGLSDYGFWSQQVKEERAARKEPDPPFRRGRIWA